MTTAVSRIVTSPVFLQYVSGHEKAILSPESRRIFQNIIADQIRYNFEASNPEVKTVQLTYTPVPFKNSLVIHLSPIGYFLGQAVILIVSAFLLNKSIYKVVFESLIGGYLGVWSALLFQQIYRTQSIWYRVIAHPSSMNIPLEQLANSKDDESDRYCDPYSREPFACDISAPRLLLCGRYVYDLPAVLCVMLNKIGKDGNIPSPLHDGVLTPEEKDKFVADISNFLSIPSESVKQCWEQGFTKEEIDLLIKKIYENSSFNEAFNQRRDALIGQNQRVDEERIRQELIASVVRQVGFSYIPQRQREYFLSLIPTASIEYFTEIVNAVHTYNHPAS